MRRSPVFIVGILITLGIAVLPGQAASAAEAAFSSDATYRLLPDENVVQVELDVTLKNNTAPTRSGNVITNFFYYRVTFPLPTEVTDITATVSRRPVSVSLEPTEKGFVNIAQVSTGSNVNYGERRTVNVIYRMPNSGPRTKGTSRVGTAHAIFPVWAVGDPGLSTVRVVLPDRFEVETRGTTEAWKRDAGEQILEVRDIDDPEKFYVTIAARDDNALATRTVEVGTNKIQLRYWPDDTAWADFVAEKVTKGIPVIESITGKSWPQNESFQFVESYSPYLYGYGGWFSPTQNRIEIGDELDDDLIFHELSHAWFNRDLFTQRWLNEGFAEEIASQVSRQLGSTPESPDAIDTSADGHVWLNLWDKPVGGAERSRAGEKYGYNASFGVIRELADEIGTDKVRAVLDAAIKNTSAYPAAEATNSIPPRTWQRLYDLAENVGGSTKIESLLRDYVLTPIEAANIPDRKDARQKYDTLKALGDGWTPPPYIGRSLDAWDFYEAKNRMAEATSALETRDKLTARATALGRTVPVSYEKAYESTAFGFEDTTAKAAALDATLTELEQTDALLKTERTFLTKVGLRKTTLEVDLVAAMYDFDADKLADVGIKTGLVREQFLAAEESGKRQVTIAAAIAGGGLLLFLLLIGLLIRRRRRRRQRALAAAAAASVDTAHVFPAPLLGTQASGPM